MFLCEGKSESENAAVDISTLCGKSYLKTSVKANLALLHDMIVVFACTLCKYLAAWVILPEHMQPDHI